MTAPTQAMQGVARPDPRAWAGLVLPGLGHLLMGRWVDALGLLGLSGLELWAAIDVGRLHERLKPPSDPEFQLHPYVAIVAWGLAAALLWHRAWRLAHPPAAIERHAETWWQLVLRQFAKNRVGVLGLYMALVLILSAFLTPAIAPYDPNQIDVAPHLAAPSFAYLMGTDNFGRDVFSRVMYGGRISLLIGFIAASISATLGTAFGAIAGYFGGAVDRAMMWVTDLLLSMPRLVLLMAIIGFYRGTGVSGIFLIITIFGLTGWMGVSRIVRSLVLSLKEQDFIQATRALGLPSRRIIFRHLIPNAIAPVIVNVSLAIGSTILLEAGLSYLGLGVPPPTATWGSIVNQGREYMRSGWWITIFPGLMIVFAVMSFNLLGDGLRDAIDPKLRGRS